MIDGKGTSRSAIVLNKAFLLNGKNELKSSTMVKMEKERINGVL